MFSWFRYTPTKPVVDPRDARIMALEHLVEKQKARAERAEAAHRVANEVASQRAARIYKLETDIAEQSSKIQTLSNLNARLERELRPFKAPRRRGAGGRFLPFRQEQAA